MHFKKYFLYFTLLFLAACTPKEYQFSEQVLFSQSNPIKLSKHDDDNSSVYVVARRGESNIQGLQSAVEQALLQKSYTIAKSPSAAGFVIHIAVPSIGTFSAEQLQTIVKAGYGKAASPKSHSTEAEKKFAMVADVLIVSRTKPEKVHKRPEVISTTSKPSKIDESSARFMVAIPEKKGGTFSDSRPHLVKEIANKIANSLP